MQKRRYSLHFIVGSLISLLVSSGLMLLVQPAAVLAEGNNVQAIAGAGPSTKVVERFAEYLSKHEAARGMTFSVPKKSIKHAGGIKSTEKNLLGRTGRPLNAKEKAMGVEELFLAKMPIAFVAGAGVGVSSLTVDQVCGLFTGKHRNWKEVGGNDKPVIIITREPTEALFLELKRDLPCMKEVVDTKYILKKDDHVIEMIRSTDVGQNAIGFGAARNFPDKVHLAVVGFDSGVGLGLVYRSSKREEPLIKAAREIAGSDAWKSELKNMGLGLP